MRPFWIIFILGRGTIVTKQTMKEINVSKEKCIFGCALSKWRGHLDCKTTVVLSQCVTVVFCHNTTVLSYCLVALAQHARLNTLDKGTVLVQLCSWSLYGAKNRGWRNYKSLIVIFAPPPKWRPWYEPCLPYPRLEMARASTFAARPARR